MAAWSSGRCGSCGLGIRAASGDESKPCLAFFVAVWTVLTHPAMCAEPRVIFLHPSPINIAAKGKSAGLGPMMISSLYFPILVPVGVFWGICMAFWWMVGERLSDTLNLLQRKPNLLLSVFVRCVVISMLQMRKLALRDVEA